MRRAGDPAQAHWQVGLHVPAKGARPACVSRFGRKARRLNRPLRAQLLDYTVTRDELIWRSSDVFKWIANGQLKVRARLSNERRLAPSLRNAVLRRARCRLTRRSLSMRRRTATCTSRRARAPARSSTPHRKRRQGPIAAPPYRAGCANDRIRRNKSALLVSIRPPMDVRPTGRAGLEGCSNTNSRDAGRTYSERRGHELREVRLCGTPQASAPVARRALTEPL